MHKPFISFAAMTIVASLLQAPAAIADDLTPHAAEYKVKVSMLSGKLTTRLAATENGYQAIHKIQPKGVAKMFARGSVEEISDFVTSDSGVFPSHYSSHDTMTRKEKHTQLLFDSSAGTVTGTVNGAEIQAALDTATHNRVSIQYQLMHDLMNGGADDTYFLFDIDGTKILNVTLIGSKEIRVPAGRFKAIGIRHQAEGSSRVTTLWCAEAFDYLPVLIEQHRKGKLRMRATLSDYTAQPG